MKDRFNFVCFKNICDNCFVFGYFFNFCLKESFCCVIGCNVYIKYFFFLYLKINGLVVDIVFGVRGVSGIGVI